MKKDQRQSIDNNSGGSNLSIKDEVEKELNKKGTFELYKKIKTQRIPFFLPFKCLPPSHKKLLGVSFVCATISGGSLPFFVSVFGVIMKNMNLGENVDDIIFSLVLIGIFQFVMSFISSFCMDIVTTKILKTLKVEFLKSVFYQDGQFHDNNPGSKLTSDLDFYLEQVNAGIGTKFLTIFTYTSAFLGLYFWSLFKNARLTLCVTCVFPLIYICGVICNKKAKINKKTSLLYNNNTMSIIEEALVGIRTVVSYCGEHTILKKFNLSEKLYSKYMLKANFMESLHIGMINGFILASYAFGFWYGTRIIISDLSNAQSNNDFHGGSVISILLGVLISMFMLTIVLPNITEYMKSLEATNSLYEIINRKPLVENNNDGKKLKDIKKIQFKNVRFHYDTRKDVEIYKDLNFTLTEGKTYAFVGESGCGKSTILKLIERLYDPTEGDIIINDSHNLKDINLKWWRSKIGVVSQDPLLFSNSIKNNIKYSLYSLKDLEYLSDQLNEDGSASQDGLDKRNSCRAKCAGDLNDMMKTTDSDGLIHARKNYNIIDDSEVVNVSKKVLIHDFVSALPDKYETLVGSNASKLSGGQKQRISIARAIIRNPKILILDEATSSLDNKSEYLVQKTINNLKGNENRITIIIAHRLSTIRYANTIFVLSNREKGNRSTVDVDIIGEDPTKDNKENKQKNGKKGDTNKNEKMSNAGSYIIEQGTHDALMKNKNGIYYTMINNQKVSSKTSNNNDNDKDSDMKSSVYKDSERGYDPDEMNGNTKNGNESASDKKSNKMSDENASSKNAGGKLSFLRNLFKRKPKAPNNLRMVYREIFSYKKDVVIIALSIIVAGGLYPMFALLYAKYVSTLFDFANLEANSNKYSLYILVIAIAMFISETLKNYYNNVIGEKVEKTMKHRLFENILYQEISFFDQDCHAPGLLSSHINRDVHLLKTGLVNNIVIFTHFIVLFIVSMIMSFYFCPIVAAVLTGTYFIFMRVFAIRARLSANKDVEKKGINQPGTVFLYNNDDEIFKDPSFLIQEAFYNMNTVIIYGLEDYFCKLIEKAIDYSNKGQKRKTLVNSMLWGFSQSAQLFINSFAYWFGSFLIRRGTIEVDDFMKSLFTFLFTGSYAGKLMSLKGDSENAKLSFEKYYPLIMRKSNIDVRDNGGIRIKNTNDIDGKIEIMDVNFTYMSRPNVPIYKDLTFSCDSKKTTAIVGETGSGKSTVMSLLMRFYDLKNDHHIVFKNEHTDDVNNEKKEQGDEEQNVGMKNVNEFSLTKEGSHGDNSAVFKNSGKILLDGVDICDYNLKDLRNLFSIVSQEPILFNMSIYENIKFGKEDATREDVKRACKFAAIDEFIESLPNKYDTNVGPYGKSLSGGQKQRVAIARALLREPKILLLDEATSSLDSNSEKLIEKTIVDIKDKADRTIITIAHRIASIKRSDKIVVFNNPDRTGSFVQAEGTHEELLSVQDGVYKKYVKLAK
ncbi:multidrug resistance protein, putative [Plasmodium knowlesi strain H]|uniref:Multidrug resistance protein, putative n=3 Tax=Plasmodium knowlesi TaxID=5850 RepID=A0A5K1UUX2_PLAKH|nr:ABC transporter B family member 1, putative [Plasmodium knowlesi strain H]OTN67098.1 putative Multidrug resistance protein [Plasmodium knowlesi]CAA9988605.1 ABC transporter B family member 1, putative [Plasmodium knowlesi strain H]SBO21436.1 multidrug resistance protein, putative [Plasmodium knowlesi strain H]SBO21879.1 multidrug resistance protein, putative [Plasmodium knowlesi strain H]VVS78079.1 ABC transporter B family member 1, putative [Plasmodium knowlesi strain H]|eukprot:XP_002259581.1 multidrug resistance protein, putative [Plasmodium knowlesi strain H]